MNQSNSGVAGAAAATGFFLILVLFEIALAVVIIAGMWKVFTKAGKPGWAAIIPIYNLIVMLEIAGKPIWWIILCLIPCVSLVVYIMILVAFAKKFGQGVGFVIGLFLLPMIFFPILGFGDSKYDPSA